MKNYIIYTVVLLVGLILGWLIFGNSSTKNDEGNTSSETKGEEIWTCSMHPQIRLPEPGDCPICGMDLIPLEANANSNPLVFEMSEDAMKIANIQTTVVGGSSEGQSGLSLSGKIKVDETNSASIVSHLPGRIEKLFISYTGEKVGKGQKIASIYSPKLITAQKELLEAFKVKDINPKLYEATVNKLKYWKITDEQIQTIISSEKILESFNIYADFSGVVLSKKVSVGDYLNEGEVLFAVQNLNELWALFDVYETDLPNVKIGDVINFTTPAIPNKVFTSTISFVDPLVNANTRTSVVRVAVNNSSNLLKPEMFLEGTVDIASSGNDVVMVPKSAVLWTGERSVVYVKMPDLTIPSFEFREVTIGEAIGTNYAILDGVEIGEEVVTNGAFVIDASAQLNNQSSMMNRAMLGDKSTNSGMLPDYTEVAPLEFKNQLNYVFQQYIALKDALIATDLDKAKKELEQLEKVVGNVQMKLVKGDAHIYWMEKLENLTTTIKDMKTSESIKSFRKVFLNLSAEIIDVVKVFGVTNQTYYVQFCPMAFDEGGFWLSTDSNVLNPYFGDKMLKCGSMELTIDKNYKNKKIEAVVSNNPIKGHNH
jgi:Cu(I)/Ag(I) efflux system membrane fusion protein